MSARRMVVTVGLTGGLLLLGPGAWAEDNPDGTTSSPLAQDPSAEPTEPNATPTDDPTVTPTDQPTDDPTVTPTDEPTRP